MVDDAGRAVEHFRLMCSAIDGDIQSTKGSGACVLEWSRKVESGEIDFVDVDGNAWVMNITPRQGLVRGPVQPRRRR